MADHQGKCRHIYTVVRRFGIPVLACIYCAKEKP
jgi:hypothetical protein